MSVFFVKYCLISVGAKQDIRHPFRGSFHLLTDDIQVDAGAAFDDQFIMDVSNDKAVPQGLHSVAENVAADCLDDVLHELRTVGFDAFPFLRGSDTFIGNGFATKLILTDAGLYIGEPATGRKEKLETLKTAAEQADEALKNGTITQEQFYRVSPQRVRN